MKRRVEVDSTCYCEFCKSTESQSDCIKFTPCNHWQCRESVAEYIKTQISQNNSRLTCQVLGCSSVVPHPVIRSLVDEEQYQHYVDISGKHALVKLVDEGLMIL